MNYSTVIFDLDGTLLDTIEDLTDGVNYVMSHFGYKEYTTRQIKGFVGNGIKRLIKNAVPQGTSEEDFEAAYRMFREYYTKNCCNKTKPYDGIMELLKELSQKSCSMAIVSNKNDAAVVELNKIFFDMYIEIAVGQSETTRKKPAPDTVYKAMEELGVSKSGTLYVGDSEVDKMTADAAGIDCVLVSWGFRDRDKLEGLKPLKVIDTPSELLEVL